MGSLREAILQADDLPREAVETPEWAPFGVPLVHIRGFSGQERDEWEQSLTERINGRVVPRINVRNIRSAFLVKVIVDENGARVFDDKDVKALGAKSGAVLDRLWDKARELSGMMVPEEQEGENPSTGDQDEPSSSESPSPAESQTSTDSQSDSAVD